MHNRIIHKDLIKTFDKVGSGIRGEVIFGTGKKSIDFIDPYGKKCSRTAFDKILYREENIVPIGAYQYIFNKLFNIPLDSESTLRVGDLNDEAPLMKIGVQKAEYSSSYYDTEMSISNSSVTPNMGINISALNFVFGFMVGEGGAKEDNITAISPDYKRRTLFNAIPFRMSNDGNSITAGKYYGKTSTIGDVPITSYYVKKFDTPAPRIIHCWATDIGNETVYIDDSIFGSTSTDEIESYVEMNLTLDEFDIRGYFTTTGSTPRVNEFGLVSGWYNAVKDDYESIRLFTHFTRPSIALADGDIIEVVYRLYAR